jgi:capsular polysaccharide biosynthesis protein
VPLCRALDPTATDLMSPTTMQTVESAAREVVTLERTPQSPECRSAAFQRHFTNRSRNPFLGWNPEPQTILNFRVPDAVLDGGFRGLLNADGLIPGTEYLLPDGFPMGIRIDASRLVPVQEAATIIIGCNLAHQNYFHWCSQALPAIDSAVRRIGQDRGATLALPQLNPWQEESLQLLGHGSLPRLTVSDPGKQYALNLAEFSQILNGGSAFALSEVLYETFTRLRRRVEKLPGAPRKLYVARTDAPTRVMRNEAAVIEEMRRRGYEIVVPGTLSFTEQVQLFRSASVVVGPHGAGLTNIVFCEPGTTVYELLSASYTNACFCNLAMVCHLEYWADAFAGDSDPSVPPNLRDWASDTALVVDRLMEIDAIREMMRADVARHPISSMDFLRGDPVVLSGQVQPEEPRPIAEAAVAVSYFERTRVFSGRGNVRLSDSLSRLRQGLSFAPINVSMTVRNYHLENVVLDADTLRLFQDGLVIPETAYFVPSHRIPASIGREDTLLQLDSRQDWIIGYNNAHLGYQHWLMQCIPAIDWSLRQSRRRRIGLILPQMEMWQAEILEILGYGGVPRLILLPGRQYLLPHAEYSDFLNGKTSFDICLSAFDTVRSILDRAPNFRSDHRIVYVPCSNPYYGTIQNEAEVIDLLRGRGVFIVDRTQLSAIERITLFRHADVVIGPLGQDLTNILFCKPGTLLWEWMPEHHQNASFNRLAQVAQADYWGDLFKSVGKSDTPGQWHIDISLLVNRLEEISDRLARVDVGQNGRVFECEESLRTSLVSSVEPGKPLEELMSEFASLGDNCEFGLVQRAGGAEPLDLFRFAGTSFENLISALERRFEGLGNLDNVSAYLVGTSGPREFMVHEKSLDTRYHTFIMEGSVGVEGLRLREARRLKFLRRKMLEDLANGEKIWVWKQQSATEAIQIYPLLSMLRRLGPNILLWVVQADEDHPPGTVDMLESDFLKGYIERFSPYESAADIRPVSWFKVCQAAYALCRTEQQAIETMGPVNPLAAARPAVEFLNRSQPGPQTAPAAPQTAEKVRSAGFWDWFRLE